MGNDENMEEQMMEVHFAVVDEFGQRTESRRTFEHGAYCDGITIPFLVEEFKLFLLGGGFSPEQVAKIKFEDN